MGDRDEVTRAQTPDVACQQRMVVDGIAKAHCVLDLPLDEFDTFERHLASTEIQ